jgi:hypothetical protein
MLVAPLETVGCNENKSGLLRVGVNSDDRLRYRLDGSLPF